MQTLELTLTNILDSVGGLPTHPLVVHVAVVMLPLATVALLAIILVPRWRAAYGWLTMAGLTVGAIGAVLAAQTGEALAEQVGLPADHALWGDLLEKAGLVLLVVAASWFLLQRRAAARTSDAERPRWASLTQTLAGALSIGLALAVLTLTVVVGHSGATAVWQGRIAAAAPSGPAQTPRTATTPSPSVSTTAPTATASTTPPATSGAITISDVQQHSTGTDCWSVVDAGVYDLTAWIPQHPGGPQVIEAMCGKDASAAFRNQHSSQGEPNAVLAAFRIGTLAG